MQIRIDQITKTFGRVRANDSISMALEGGRIYAVLGENGAGKSTLMKILSGYQPADSGRILLDGQEVRFATPADALITGIGMLHQDPLDVPNLTALENFMLGKHEGLLPKRRTALTAFREVGQRLGFDLNPDAYIDSLTIGERQQLEIVRLLSMGARVLILDEPTTGISAAQKETLFNSLKHLAHEQGVTVILVSHKLEDVEALCDQVLVLRAGKLVGERAMPISAGELVTLMFGQSLERKPRPPAPKGDAIFEAAHLTILTRRLTVHDLSLKAHAGEVIGLAGLDGSGQREFLRACAGLQPPQRGHLRLHGRDVSRADYHQMARFGVAYAPSGRLEEGLVAGLTVVEHFALARPGGLWIRWGAVRSYTQKQIDHYHIKGQPESQIQMLSGGNQQRTLIALLPDQLSLLLLEDPTRGLDVESARWVWEQLLERRAKGTTILFISPDLDEIIEYSDRVLVFFGGRATLVDDPAHMTTEGLGRLIGGKS
ncbi:MAG: ATP-binding cassette domain-containing protein [Anaerolinea sp.]|nr:ATP-binding cassette domain-containing protein [Anaerolinea sp.]CAG0955427.1 Galactose/methyl galactoside import ATP-binding protein MglA [Anaerolineae bacterium]